MNSKFKYIIYIIHKNKKEEVMNLKGRRGTLEELKGVEGWE